MEDEVKLLSFEQLRDSGFVSNIKARKGNSIGIENRGEVFQITGICQKIQGRYLPLWSLLEKIMNQVASNKSSCSSYENFHVISFALIPDEEPPHGIFSRA
jgi:hypothetical protein